MIITLTSAFNYIKSVDKMHLIPSNNVMEIIQFANQLLTL
jgi:hypothetical protein